MKTNQEHFQKHPQHRTAERGAALVYILIAIALMAALSFTLSRQTDTSETSQLDDDRAEIYATQLISSAAQVKSAIDQLRFSGVDIDNFDFELPADDDDTVIYKVFHPQGGGVTLPHLPVDATAQISTNPPAGWYLGRFNNVEWTASANQDVILTAYQISQIVCEKINEKITGTSAIPALDSGDLKDFLVDSTYSSGGNSALTTNASGVCPECNELASLCIANSASSAYAFYTVVADQ